MTASERLPAASTGTHAGAIPSHSSTTPEQTPAESPVEASGGSAGPVRASDEQRVFTVEIVAEIAGTLRFTARPMRVPADATMVTPPEPPGCPWTSTSQVTARHDAVPPGCDWMDTSVWISNAAYPTAPAAGTTYIYAHACRYHRCPLTPVKQLSTGYTVQAGDTVTITDRSAPPRTYRVCGVAASPKSGPARAPSCDGRVDLDIVTCRYDARGESVANIIIAAMLSP